jgi:hypothetical protein
MMNETYLASLLSVPTTPAIPQHSAFLSFMIPEAMVPAAAAPARIFIQSIDVSRFSGEATVVLNERAPWEESAFNADLFNTTALLDLENLEALAMRCLLA